MDLLAHVVRFARMLRARGVSVGIGDEVDAVTALTMVDLFDRREVHRALRTALKIRPPDWDAFDRAFVEAWTGRSPALGPKLEQPSARPLPARSDLFRHSRHPVGGSSDDPAADAPGDRPGYSPEALLRRKPFEQCSFDDLRAMSRLVERLARRLATRMSRRLVPTHGRRGRVDTRRSFRRSLQTGGEVVWLARRARAIEVPRLVVLCDTSGSMDTHMRFLLTFLVALKRHVPRTDVFAFNTSLVRITPWLVPGTIALTLEHLGAAVPDWSGGTRIGESLSEFVGSYAGQLVRGRTIVLIFSDGLDRGDTALVGEAMRVIHERSRTVVWLNPLGGDPRYEPTARAMQAALPFIDCLAPAHNLESLEHLVSDLDRAGRNQAPILPWRFPRSSS